MGKGTSGPLAVNVSDGAGEVGGRGRSGGPLAVNKASSKIGKGLRQPIVQPRAAPQIYKTAPSDFRSLVQQLTGGTSSSPGTLERGPAPIKPSISRLQRIAPPPLRPNFVYQSSIRQQQPQTAATSSLPLATSAPPGFSSLPFGGSSPQNYVQKLSPFPVSPLSFSPLPVLTPSDQVWASSLSSLESPRGAQLQQQKLVESAMEGEANNLRQKSSAADAPPALLAPIPSQFEPAPPPLFPKFAIPYGLPSPTDLGSFGMFGMSSPSFSPTGSLTTFRFPELDTSISGPTMS